MTTRIPLTPKLNTQQLPPYAVRSESLPKGVYFWLHTQTKKNSIKANQIAL